MLLSNCFVLVYNMAASFPKQRHRQSVSNYLRTQSSRVLSPGNHDTSKHSSLTPHSETSIKSKRLPKTTKIPMPSSKVKLPLLHNNNVRQRKAKIDDLPDEMLSFIFFKLPVGDLITASQVCKRWHGVTSDNLLWQKLYAKFAGPLSQEKLSEKPVHELNPGIWKQLCLKRCKLKRDAIYLKKFKKPDSYTGLKQRPELTLGKVGVRFELSFLDDRGVSCTVDHNDMFWSYTSLTVRWYSLVFPTVHSIRRINIYACSPLMFYGPAKPAKDGMFQKSLLVSRKVESSLTSLTEVGSESHVKLYVLAKGLLMALYQVDGEIAFITAMFHNHDLVSRCLSGSIERCWSPPEPAVIEDDIDPNYGLHGYTCVLLLRNMRQKILECKFMDLHCTSTKLVQGFAVYNPVRRDDKLSHVTCLKDISLPWKTMFFKGIIRDLALLDVTVIDERGEPFWTVSSLVNVTRDALSDQFEFDEEQYRSIRFEDETGKIHLEIGKLEDHRQYLSHAAIFLSVKVINQAFNTVYPLPAPQSSPNTRNS